MTLSKGKYHYPRTSSKREQPGQHLSMDKFPAVRCGIFLTSYSYQGTIHACRHTHREGRNIVRALSSRSMWVWVCVHGFSCWLVACPFAHTKIHTYEERDYDINPQIDKTSLLKDKFAWMHRCTHARTHTLYMLRSLDTDMEHRCNMTQTWEHKEFFKNRIQEHNFILHVLSLCMSNIVNTK